MWIVADVTFDTDTEAREAERLAREGKLAGISVDPGGIPDFRLEMRGDEEWVIFTSYIIGGVTQVAIPAFRDARIEFTDAGPIAWVVPEGIETDDWRSFEVGSVEWRDSVPLMFNDSSDGHDGAIHVGNLTNFRRVAEVALVASANPQLAGLMKPMVQDGKIVGHGAGWGTCHVGIPGTCVTPPSSTYRHVADGVKIYQHPRGDVHAPLSMSLADACKWYDTHCEIVGVAGVGEDEHGIWVAGDATLDDGEVFLSGDWRVDDDGLELISFLVVQNPGYPVAQVASDHQVALVAAGIVTETEGPTIDARLARLESVLFTPTPSQDLVDAFAVTEAEQVETLTEAFAG